VNGKQRTVKIAPASFYMLDALPITQPSVLKH